MSQNKREESGISLEELLSCFRSAKKKDKKEPMTITCERCGKEIVLTDGRQSRRKYCEDCQKIVYAELRNKAHKKYMASRPAKNDDGQIICKRCGVPFESEHKRKYCDDCRDIVKNEQTTAARKKREGAFLGMDFFEDEQSRKTRESKIDELQREAHASGMSYGKYVAMLSMRKEKAEKEGVLIIYYDPKTMRIVE